MTPSRAANRVRGPVGAVGVRGMPGVRSTVASVAALLLLVGAAVALVGPIGIGAARSAGAPSHPAEAPSAPADLADQGTADHLPAVVATASAERRTGQPWQPSGIDPAPVWLACLAALTLLAAASTPAARADRRARWRARLTGAPPAGLAVAA